MKKILIIAVVISVCACSNDLLDTSPYSSVSSETMWTTDNLTDLGVNGVYAALRLGIGGSGYELYQMDRFGMTGQPRSTEALLTGTITSSAGMFSDNWKFFYEGIQRANDAISNIPVKSPSTTTKKARYIAECKFLRAFFYLRLNQLYKGVPIYLEHFTDVEAIKPRATEADVWNQIISDLTDCINEPNLPSRYNANDANYGHITKGAAYALRGKSYLYLKKWDLAATDFSKVKDAGYALFNNYTTLFKTANEQCPEMIFSIQNIAVSGYGSQTQFYCGSRSSFGSCWNYYLPSNDLVDLYENADGSKFNWDNVIPGYSSLSKKEREVFFLRDNLTVAEINAATTRGAKMSLYLPVGNEARILKAYTNRDPRLAATVITPYSTYKGVFNNLDATVTMRWPFRAEAAVNGDLRTDTQNYLYYLYRKFVYEGVNETPARDYGPTDMPVIRYADVLLMWAEALNEQGLMTDAIAKVNEVRTRAGVIALNSNTATTVLGQDDLRERIRNERRVEFPNEGINFFDELRWGTWKDKVFYPGNGEKQVWGANVYDYSYMGDYIYNWAIPQAEIQINNNLTQNQGWIQ